MDLILLRTICWSLGISNSLIMIIFFRNDLAISGTLGLIASVTGLILHCVDIYNANKP